MKNYPLVTIGIPTYKRPQYLERAVKSALNQTWPNLEILVSDNATPSPLREQVDSVMDGFKDPRIRFVRQKRNLGMMRNFSYLFNHSRGEFFIFCADDDYFMNDNYIERLMKILEDKTVILACGIMTWEGNKNPEKFNLNVLNEGPFSRAVNQIFKDSDFGIYGLTRKLPGDFGFFPLWHWPNRGVSRFNAHPYVFDRAIRGKIKTVDIDDDPVFYFKSCPEKYYKWRSCSNVWLNYFAFWAMKLNLFEEYVRDAYSLKGPVFALGIGFFCVPELIRLMFRSLGLLSLKACDAIRGQINA